MTTTSQIVRIALKNTPTNRRAEVLPGLLRTKLEIGRDKRWDRSYLEDLVRMENRMREIGVENMVQKIMTK